MVRMGCCVFCFGVNPDDHREASRLGEPAFEPALGEALRLFSNVHF
jgi:hypothetical protein